MKREPLAPPVLWASAFVGVYWGLISTFVLVAAIETVGGQARPRQASEATVIPQTYDMTVLAVCALDPTVVEPVDEGNVGDEIDCTITLTNAGTGTLTTVTVVTDPSISLSCTPTVPDASLATTDTIVCTGTYTLVSGDVATGSVSITATGDSVETAAELGLSTVTLPGDTLISQGVHPRLIITSSTVAAHRTRATTANASGGSLTQFQQFANRLNANYATTTALTFATTSADAANYAYLYALNVENASIATALSTACSGGPCTAIDTQAEVASKAKALLLSYVGSATTRTQDGCASAGAKVWYAYDWIFAELSDANKETIVSWAVTYCTQAVVIGGFGLTEEGGIWNDQTAGVRPGFALAGLAFSGDRTGAGEANEGNVAAQTRVDFFTSGVYGAATGIVDGRNAVAGASGGFGQQRGYAYEYDREMDMFATVEAYRTSSTTTASATYWADITYAKYMAQIEAYLLLPYGTAGAYEVAKMPRDHNGHLDDGDHWIDVLNFTQSQFSSASDAGVAQWLETLVGIDASDNGLKHWHLFRHLLFGGNPTAVDPITAGYSDTKYFDPYGLLIARTTRNNTWFHEDDSYLQMHIARWGRPTGYWRPGSAHLGFERQGPILILGGVTGHQAYASSFNNANEMIFPLKDLSAVPPVGEPYINPSHMQTYALWGGHRTGTSGVLSLTHATRGYQIAGQATDMGGKQRMEDTSEYLYLLVDATRGYQSDSLKDSGQRTAIERYTRSVVWFKSQVDDAPDFLLIADRVRLNDTGVEARQNWSPAGLPTVGGSSAAGPSRWGSTAGKTQYTGAGSDAIAWSNADTAMNGFMTVALPATADRAVVTISGANAAGDKYAPDHEGYAITGFTHDGAGTATATTSTNLTTAGVVTGDIVQICCTNFQTANAYNTTAVITVTGANTFTFPISGSPTTPLNGSFQFGTNPAHFYENAYGLQMWDGNNDRSEGTDTQVGVVGGRFEIINTSTNLEMDFHTCMEVSPTTKTTTEAVTGTHFAGCRQGNYIAVVCLTASCAYSPQVGTSSTPPSEARRSTGTIILPDVTTTFTVLIADLPTSAARTLSKGASLGTVSCSGDVDLTVTSSAEGTLYCTIAVTSGGSAASRTLTIN